MNLRWLVFDYVDPELALTPAQRKRIRVRGLLNPPMTDDLKPVNVPWYVIVLAILAPAMGMALGFATFFIFFTSNLWGIPVMFAVQFLSTWLLLAIVGNYTWRPLVCAELRDMGHEVCAHCGYWLRGLPPEAKHCPECGTERETASADAGVNEGATP